MKYSLLCYLLSLFLLTNSISIYSLESTSEEQVNSFLKNMNETEKNLLEDFFKELITKHHFGYVLFGNKPMATCGIAEHIDVLYLFSDEALRNQKLQRGWQTWQAKHQFLGSDNFILRITKNPLCPSMRMLILINRQKCLSCIKNHIKIFQKALNTKVNAEEILINLETRDSILQDVLNNQEELFGILLGYGAHNSSAYVKNKPFNRHFFYAAKKTLQPISLLSSELLTIRLTPFNIYDSNLLFIDLPRFAEDAHTPESIVLKKSYLKTWEKLTNLFFQKKFLEIALTRWLSDTSEKKPNDL